MDPCSCSSGKDFSECCGPILAGQSPAGSPEALMRARYTAFAKGNVEFLRDTIWPANREDFEEESVRRWAQESKWTGLEILRTEAGGPDDDRGVVEFVAHFEAGGVAQTHHEVADFNKDEGVWFFFDGKRVGSGTYVRPGPKIGRNDPCPCGSGKKFKKCCALAGNP